MLNILSKAIYANRDSCCFCFQLSRSMWQTIIAESAQMYMFWPRSYLPGHVIVYSLQIIINFASH